MTGEISQLVAARLARAERENRSNDARLPHVVVCSDLQSGFRSYAGPYLGRSEAEAAAEYEEFQERGSGQRIRFTVEPLYPPIDGRWIASSNAELRRQAAP